MQDRSSTGGRKCAWGAPRERVVVVAAKAPQAGKVKTRLCPPLSPDQAAQLARAFLRDTLQTASSPALRADLVLAVDGTLDEGEDIVPHPNQSRARQVQQTGNSLGERLVLMIDDAFGAGHRFVCVIGSDVPHLPAAFLLEAWGRLERDADVVLGPSDDGGYTLVAVARSLPVLFRDIAWSSPHVLAQTQERARTAGLSVALLAPWYDIDTWDDVRRLRQDLHKGVVRAPATAQVLEALAS